MVVNVPDECGLPGKPHQLVIARDGAHHGVVKFFLGHTPLDTPTTTRLLVAFSYWGIEAGLDHSEGRTWTGLKRQLALSARAITLQLGAAVLIARTVMTDVLSCLAKSSGKMVFCPLSLLLVQCLLGCSTVSGADVLSANESSAEPKNAQICGIYALYCYLQCMGRDVPYQRICEVVPVSARGSSLLEIRDGAKQLGLNLEIRKASPKDRSVPQQGPFIAHMRKRRVTEDKYSEPEFDGHYVVVLPPAWWRKPGEIDAIDGTHGLIETYSFSGFPKLWTGYYLVEKHLWIADHWVDLILVASNFLLASCLYHIQMRRTRGGDIPQLQL